MDNVYHLSTNCYFDVTNRCISDINMQPICHLTKLQFNVLEFLITNAGATLKYNDILDRAWECTNDYPPTNKNLMDVVSQLRKILCKIDASLKDCIKTVRGVGLSFNCDYHSPICSTEKVRIVTCRELFALGYTPIGIASKLMNNDFSIYGNIGEKNQGTAETWAKFIKAYPETFQCALAENNDIVGNWSFCAPKKEQIELIKACQVNESTFNLNNQNYITFPDKNGYYDGFILNMAFTPAYRSSENEHLLFDSFADQLLKWANLDVYFRTIYVNVFIEEQKRFYENLGFTEIGPNVPNGTIYKIDLTDFPQTYSWIRYKDLRKTYNDYFKTTITS